MKILVLTNKYFPCPYANALCAQEIIDVWTSQGIDVDVLAYQDDDGTPTSWKGNRIYYVQPNLSQRLFYYATSNPGSKKGKMAEIAAHVISKLEFLIFFPWQPFKSPSFVIRIYKAICRLNAKESYDAIVAILNPLHSAIAGAMIKKRNPNIAFIVYSVDTLKKTKLVRILSKLHITKNIADGYIWEKYLLKCCDAYYYMKSRKSDFSMSRYAQFREKLIETDLPRLKVRTSCKRSYEFHEEGKHWVYAGSIGGVHYDPSALLSIFEKISSGQKRFLHLYIRGSMSKIIEETAKRNGWNVRVHDYVDAATLESIMNSADVLVSLKNSDQISAKIFECMSYGKPIVHFSGCTNDPNIQYLRQYPICQIVKTYDLDMGSQIKELQDFISKYEGTEVDTKDILNIFKMSTPEFSAHMILNSIKKVQTRKSGIYENQ